MTPNQTARATLRRWVDGSSPECQLRYIRRSFRRNHPIIPDGVLLVIGWTDSCGEFKGYGFSTGFLGTNREQITALAVGWLQKKGWV